jgi:hypothetical protein
LPHKQPITPIDSGVRALQTVNTGSLFWSTMTLLSYFYMVRPPLLPHNPASQRSLHPPVRARLPPPGVWLGPGQHAYHTMHMLAATVWQL